MEMRIIWGKILPANGTPSKLPLRGQLKSEET